MSALDDFLQQTDYGAISSRERLTGGSINTVERLRFETGLSLILKQLKPAPANFFQAEASALAALRQAQTLRVPVVIHDANEFLLLEDLGDASPTTVYWQNLGEGLAELHQETHTQFGFEGDNFCGALPQRNPRLDDGFEFFANYRLLGPAKAAHERGMLEDRDRDDLEFIANRLEAWIPKQDAVLIHGDLWSGNIHCDGNGEPALIDPASYWGWGEAELAMTRLFGSFSSKFYESYASNSPMDAHWQERAALYNLYHLLNHLLLFGGAYLPQIREITRRYAGKPGRR